MNIEEYDKKVGFNPSPPTCIYCDSHRFYRDLCVKHTKNLLIKLQVIRTLFSGDADIVDFFDTAVRELNIESRIEAMNDAIAHLHHIDNMSIKDVAKALDVSEYYVREVLK